MIRGLYTILRDKADVKGALTREIRFWVGRALTAIDEMVVRATRDSAREKEGNMIVGGRYKVCK
jgi:hypothetical protein